MKKTIFALSLLASLTACSQTPEDAILLSVDDSQVVFTSTSTGELVAEQHFDKGAYTLSIANAANECGHSFALAEDKRIRFNTPMTLDNCVDSSALPLKIYKANTYQFSLNPDSKQLTVKVKPKKASITSQCPVATAAPKTIDVSKTFADGVTVKDALTGNQVVVQDGAISLQPGVNSQGLLLLEEVIEKETPAFSWDNATVYFVMTDRFYNGNPDNDNSYGRSQDGQQEIGTFHGGDLAGLTKKLDYIESLGVNAIWITSPLEQIHGWVGGGDRGDFKHYGYHGYYHQDWTKLDDNMGTEEELRTFIDTAHEKGIRIVWDVVMNHTGYATLADMQTFDFGQLYLNDEEAKAILGERWTDWTPKSGQNWHSFNDYIKYNDDEAWNRWWGTDWLRTDIGNYDSPGYNDITMSLNYLPDLKTESTQTTGLPNFYHNKQTNALDNQATPREHLITWLSDWVREYGVDGFRIDTAKHVEMEAWDELKQSTNTALAQWKANNPDKALDDLPFWMTGEVWAHGVVKSNYFDQGFDSIINFEFQSDVAPKALTCFAHLDQDYRRYAKAINSDDDFNVLSYLSSHDTALFWASRSKSFDDQRKAANALMLAPGAVQIYYGDEVARDFGPTGSDSHQGTRSDMPWDSIEGERELLLKHWQTLGEFRQRHPAVAQGQHITRNQDGYYAFERQYQDDKVLIVYTGE
ncbi:alpha-amylase [Vibrio sp. 10N.286.49.B3]|uniref:alpha-amylase n=1 Tax=Vibrio sp. 10N.286.49.B3 TaxID=1880855 RepID=UPI000C866B6E|nr:alpha-amylase [Vibrio sp. 10N.286.49.B3]PMH41460.1 alpha-amylase [Vibrio sp. 10N.286.49.B3]